MSRIVEEDIGKFGQHYPKVPVIITASAHGRDDAMTAAWHSSISVKPPLYGVAIASKRFTYQLLAQSREFAINFIPYQKASVAAVIGGISGEQIDKFERLSIQREKSLKTTAPVLKDAYATYECKLADERPYGDHIWIVGEIVAVHFLEEAFAPGGILDLDKVNPLLYIGSDSYTTTDKDSVVFMERGT